MTTSTKMNYTWYSIIFISLSLVVHCWALLNWSGSIRASISLSHFRRHRTSSSISVKRGKLVNWCFLHYLWILKIHILAPAKAPTGYFPLQVYILKIKKGFNNHDTKFDARRTILLTIRCFGQTDRLILRKSFTVNKQYNTWINIWKVCGCLGSCLVPRNSVR